MERIEDFIDECIKLFGGEVIQVRYTEERKKRLINYLKRSKENRNQKVKDDAIPHSER
jgi:hypothetical protein